MAGPAPLGTPGADTARRAGELPVLDLPTDRPRSAPRDPGTHTAPLRVPAGAADAMRALAAAAGCAPEVVALGVTTVALAHLARQRDVVVGTPGGRTPLVHVALDGDPDLHEVLRRVRDAGEADPGDPGEPAGVRAVFSSDPGADGLGAYPGAELAVLVHLAGDAVLGSVALTAALHDAPSATRYAEVVAHLLATLPAAPDDPVLAHPALPPAERERVLHHLNPYRRPEVRHTTMAQPFEEQVRRTPDAEALVGDEGSMTYASLNEHANRLAWFLRRAGAGPGTRVVVSLERGFALLVALYAVAKTGAAYVPIDPELPDGRMAYMLEDSAPVAVLVDRTTRSRLPAGGAPVLAVDDDTARWADEPADDLPPEPGNHLVHLLYTSGTTGRPKAVAYPVEGALADTFWLHERYPYRPGDTAVLKTSYGFDVSIWEIFWPLYCGSRLAVSPPGAHRDPVRLHEVLDTYRVTAMFMVPTMMQPFLDRVPAAGCPSLRRVYVGGEPVTPRVRDAFHARLDAELVNLCGPTELGCMAETVLEDTPGEPVMIGTPPPHRRVYVLDDTLDPTPVGVPGEMFVGGDVGIAQGYHGRAALTAERFLADPYGPPGARMYRTGDLGRYREGGVLEHLGRVGRQVKVRGVRVELGEVEAVLAEHEDVAQCVVAVVPGDETEVAAFVVPAGGWAPTPRDLAEHARRMLPAAMVPATITVVDHVPTFVHGKTDVAALLRQIDRSGGEAAEELVPPEGVYETRLAGLFAELLGRDRVTVTETFFALGGHSVLLFQLVDRLASEFHVDLSVRDILESLSVRDLAVLVERAAEGGPEEGPGAGPGPCPAPDGDAGCRP